MKITPPDNYVLIKPDPRPSVSDGGIYPPEVESRLPQTGVVVAIGTGEYHAGVLVPIPLTPGQRVLFEPGYRDLTKIKADGETLLVMERPQIIGTIDDQLHIKNSGFSNFPMLPDPQPLKVCSGNQHVYPDGSGSCQCGLTALPIIPHTSTREYIIFADPGDETKVVYPERNE